jgi:hypothetical protein
LAAGAEARGRVEPKRASPIVTIVKGSDWNLVSWRDVHGGLCFAYGAPGAAGNGCSPLPTRILTPPLVYAGAFPDRWRVVGLTSAAVPRVELRLPNGRVVAARSSALPDRLHAQLRFYVLKFRLKPGPPSRAMPRLTLHAYDSTGRVAGSLVI